MNRAAILLSLALLVSACQTPMTSGSQCVVEPGYLAQEEQIAWLGDDAVDIQDNTGYISPIVTAALRGAVEQEVAAKGFAFSESAATQIRLVLRTRRELVSVEPAESPCDHVDCWERIDMNDGARMEIRTIGFLAADVYHEDKPIWRGWVETNLFPKDRDQSEAVIARAIPLLFETFPP